MKERRVRLVKKKEQGGGVQCRLGGEGGQGSSQPHHHLDDLWMTMVLDKLLVKFMPSKGKELREVDERRESTVQRG